MADALRGLIATLNDPSNNGKKGKDTGDTKVYEQLAAAGRPGIFFQGPG